jgi:hypothetical protein
MSLVMACDDMRSRFHRGWRTTEVGVHCFARCTPFRVYTQSGADPDLPPLGLSSPEPVHELLQSASSHLVWRRRRRSTPVLGGLIENLRYIQSGGASGKL